MQMKVTPIRRDNLKTRIYSEMRQALMEGRLEPRQRIKIHELADQFGTSSTPVREALLQLVQDRALELKTASSFRVPALSVSRYLETRAIRIKLETLAGEEAVKVISDKVIDHLEMIHEKLVDAERTGEYKEAVRLNQEFHFTFCRISGNSTLIDIIETLWMQAGPILNLQYPHAPPKYAGVHQHVNIIAGFRRRSAATVHQAIEDDLLEGGATLIKYLEELEEEEGDQAMA